MGNKNSYTKFIQKNNIDINNMKRKKNIRNFF